MRQKQRGGLLQILQRIKPAAAPSCGALPGQYWVDPKHSEPDDAGFGCGVAKGSAQLKTCKEEKGRVRVVLRGEEEEKEEMAAVTLMQPGAQDANDQYR